MSVLPRRGFTLIELLVVIAIIAILASILFPVFARAREKARQSTCSSNQRQIAASIQMYAQDHDETLPLSASVWSNLTLDAGILICPTKGRNTPNGYGYFSPTAGKALGTITDPTTSYLTGDSDSPRNLLETDGDVAKRHTNQVIFSFLDGHVSMDTYYRSFSVANIDLMDPSVMPLSGSAFANPYPTTNPVWTRSPATDSQWRYTSPWGALAVGGYTAGFDQDDGQPAPCIDVEQYGGGTTVWLQRALPNYVNLREWTFSGNVKFSPGGNRNLYVIVNDSTGVNITNLARYSSTISGSQRILFDNVALMPSGTSVTDAAVTAFTGVWQTFKISVSNQNATLEYGNTVTQLPTIGSNWNNPAFIIIESENGGHGGGLKVDNLKFGVVQ